MKLKKRIALLLSRLFFFPPFGILWKQKKISSSLHFFFFFCGVIDQKIGIAIECETKTRSHAIETILRPAARSIHGRVVHLFFFRVFSYFFFYFVFFFSSSSACFSLFDSVSSTARDIRTIELWSAISINIFEAITDIVCHHVLLFAIEFWSHHRRSFEKKKRCARSAAGRSRPPSRRCRQWKNKTPHYSNKPHGTLATVDQSDSSGSFFFFFFFGSIMYSKKLLTFSFNREKEMKLTGQSDENQPNARTSFVE